jgi:ssDNA-binding Zn-finger/Zn-ribbon topoisomerase 1
MSLKCSVFGHRFGDPDVEREREEQGSEVVITITETETCERCGETRVVSENKEVTTLETPSDIVGDDLEGESAPEGSANEADAGGGGGTDRPGATEGDRPAADPTPSDRPATGTGGSVDPEDDDAEIVDADPIEEAETGDASDGGGDRHSTDDGTATEAGSGGTGSATDANAGTATEDDGVIIDEDDEDEKRAPGEWPQEDTDEADDWAPPTDDGELRPIEEEQPTVESTREAMTVPEGEFRCPECGFTTAVESSSLREGDFCPECHRGTLTHEREREE